MYNKPTMILSPYFCRNISMSLDISMLAEEDAAMEEDL